jgi:oxygen-independent coproporphyrinogen III oxidase
MRTIGKLKSVSLYFHIPFFTKKCRYCHFYVIPEKDIFKVKLLDGFKKELDRWHDALSSTQIETIYFGGGTPALIGADAIHRILGQVRRIAPLADKAEITLEANPENISVSLIKSYADAGINRISMGIQTLDDDLLTLLGRTHTANKAIESVYDIAKGAISNVSIDLMYDLPGQSYDHWTNTLAQIVHLPITHISLYNLTIEPHTSFFKYKEQISKLLPADDVSVKMYETAIEKLQEYGFKQYEISAFAKFDCHSRHNAGYWKGRPFLGIGPSSFSYWEGKRFRNIANLNQYHQRLVQGLSPVDFSEQLDPLHARRELLTIHLRLTEGVNLDLFEASYGTLDSELTSTLHSLESEGYLQRIDHVLKLTRKGTLFYDSIASDII